MTTERTPSYINGDKSTIGPSKNKGGYTLWNWCCKCTSIWDKTYRRCGHCHNKVREKGRYECRRNNELRKKTI